MTTGEKIKALRQQVGLSQAQLAEELHVSRAAIAKWENENGMPDVTNLKSLAEYFHSDVDILLDETKSLEADKKEEVQLNPNTYCGKRCEMCTYREKLGCAGCKLGPGELVNGSCEIAKCCRNHRQRSCERCSIKQHCGKLSRAESMPEKREKQRQQELFLQDRLQRQAPFFGKWLWLLFWLGCFSQIAPCLIIGLFLVNESFLPIGFIGLFTSELACGLIVLRLSRECHRFKTAGILYLIRSMGTAVICIVLADASGWISFEWISTGWLVLSLIIYSVFAIIGNYHEYMGYSTILKHFYDKLSAKWENLCFVHMAFLVGSVICSAISRAIVLMGVVEWLCDVGVLVVSIIKLVYLYRTAKFFRDAI